MIPFRHHHTDIDDMDDALNAYLIDPAYVPADGSATETLNTHRKAMSVVRSDPAASGPAAGTWNRVLRSTAQSSSKGSPEMSTAVIPSAFPLATPRPMQRSDGRSFISIAASVLVIAAIAFSGWFAVMNLGQGGGDSGLYGMYASTPKSDAASCDITPLTVDEVVAIIENPFSMVDQSWWATPAPGDDTSQDWLTQNQQYVVAPFIWQSSLPYPGQGAYGVPDQPIFEEAALVVDQYLVCLSSGTMGQIWAMTEPTMIQRTVLARFPVYRDRTEIRSFVEELINQPADQGFDSYARSVDFVLSSNPDRGYARVYHTASPEFADYDMVMAIGWRGTDANGETVFMDDWSALTVDGDSSASNGTSTILVHSQSTGRWFIADTFAPRG